MSANSPNPANTTSTTLWYCFVCNTRAMAVADDHSGHCSGCGERADAAAMREAYGAH